MESFAVRGTKKLLGSDPRGIIAEIKIQGANVDDDPVARRRAGARSEIVVSFYLLYLLVSGCFQVLRDPLKST
jgi:hypothetical protein